MKLYYQLLHLYLVPFCLVLYILIHSFSLAFGKGSITQSSPSSTEVEIVLRSRGNLLKLTIGRWQRFEYMSGPEISPLSLLLLAFLPRRIVQQEWPNQKNIRTIHIQIGYSVFSYLFAMVRDNRKIKNSQRNEKIKRIISQQLCRRGERRFLR